MYQKKEVRSGENFFKSAQIEWIFMLCGVYGILFFAFSMDRLSWNPWITCAVGALTEFVLWRVYQMEERKLFWILSAAIPALLGVILWFSEELQVQLRFMVNNFPNTSGYAVDVGGAMTWLAVALALVVFWLEGVARIHAPLLLLTAVLVPVAPIAGVYPKLICIFFLLVFQLGCWGLRGAGRARKHSGTPKRPAGNPGRQVAFTVLLGFPVLFLAAWLVVGLGSEPLYTVSYQAEGAVRRAVQQNLGNANNPNTGVISRGNLYPVGSNQLKITSDSKPEETLYLRGFFGGDYQDGVWQTNQDEEIFDEVATEVHINQKSVDLSSLLETMYVVTNQEVQRIDPSNLRIEDLAKTGTSYKPYYSRENAAVSFREDYMYQALYFPFSKMDINWEDESTRNGAYSAVYLNFREAYSREAAKVYTQVPSENFPNLVRHCQKNDLQTLDEITAFILYTLQNDTTYTRTPGFSPTNQDPVEYFLFNSKKGYCQHYASAAVVMYRMFGIPARYATGYVAFPDDFQSDGQNYSAIVTDEAAHAWVEIFLDDYGWTPVEVTPSGEGISGGYPGLSSETLQEILASQDWDLSVLEETTSNRFTAYATAGTASWFGLIPVNGYTIALAMVLLLLVTVGVYWLYRHIRLAHLQRMDSRQLFEKLMQALHFCGRLRDYEGGEIDFQQQFIAALPEFKPKELDGILDTVNRAAFGGTRVAHSQTKAVRNFYFRVAKRLYAQLPIYKKFFFRFVKFFF